MRDLDANPVVNPLALKPSLVSLRGRTVPLPGLISPEPLARGCDQQAWLAQLAGLGLSHVVLPVNGLDEDTCVFARHHREPDPADATAHSGAFYDLQHRDEGFFTRLKFLLDAADAQGAVVGLSLFDLATAREGGPLNARCNRQGAGWRDGAGFDAAQLLVPLKQALDWIAAELRGRQAVWVELFRGVSPLTVPELRPIEHELTRHLASALARSGEAPERARLGPWLAAPRGFDWSAAQTAHAAPFDVRHGAAPERHATLASLDPRHATRAVATALPDDAWSDDDLPRRPRLFELPSSGAPKRASPSRTRLRLWRMVFRGGWPLIQGKLEGMRRPRPEIQTLAQIAQFCVQWVGHGYLRPSPELLAPMPTDWVGSGNVATATDGMGRSFVFAAPPPAGLCLRLLPGGYRFYWFDVSTGRAVDHGDGVVGGLRSHVPVPTGVNEALLIVEQEELPDPLSTW